ncbi:MAG: hypothetical protein IJU70_09115 [Lentisphaeria bacterium]|nr:hypothetical protein [Lentisphaeria bacterium]
MSSDLMDRALHGDGQAFDTARKLAALSSVLEGNDAVASMIAADKAVFTLQGATAAAEGRREGQDIVEDLIDRGAVYVATWAEQRCVQLCEEVGEKIGSAIGGVFGPVAAEAAAKVGKVVGRWVGEKLKPVVQKGVEIIAEGAKTVWRAIKDVGSSILGGIGRVCSTVAGWFGF